MQPPKQKKILIVDDAGYIRILFREALKNEGYEILTCENIASAYETIIQTKPALMLLDISLPDGSGVDLLKQLRKERIVLPVIMITAVSSKDLVLEALKLGIKSYLTKPVDIRILKLRVKEALDEPIPEN
ncbi:MAG: response regulator transcription factor [Candidatus Wallbacteria bacterium]|nr:response regulator transcription factor [Candidatus Wallbacteria bacterium]